jgi:ubiquinone biosynthesis protein
MGRLLGQLFEITGLFDMHLRPELVLLQKTMVTVEGVARRIDADSDIWEAARPVVERWIGRELSPVVRLQRLGERGLSLLELTARRLETEPEPVVVQRGVTDGVWIAIGFATTLAGAALAIAILRHG